MFYNKKNEVVAKSGKSDAIGTILGQETLLEGLLTTSETVRIDGLLKGEIRSEGSVIIGETGKVDGNIHALNILVAGLVDGNITIDERMEVTSTGMIVGDIVTKILVIEEGGSFKGNCSMETMMSKPAQTSEWAENEAAATEDKASDTLQGFDGRADVSLGEQGTKKKNAGAKGKGNDEADMDSEMN